MIFISAGHNSKSKSIRQDSGAIGNGYKEGDLTIEFRDLVCKELDKLGMKYIKDSDEESLQMYLQRINTGSASVVIEYHFDAGPPTANGTTGVVENDGDRLDKLFAKEITDANANVLGLRNRGVISEAQTHRGRLGLMKEEGIICLSEIGFISYKADIDKYNLGKHRLAEVHARIIKKFEDLIK